MKKYNIRLNFFYDDEDEMKEFSILVPNKITVAEISDALLEAHRYLDEEDKTGTYDRNGRNPETLLIYACEEHGWRWEELTFDVDLNFD